MCFLSLDLIALLKVSVKLEEQMHPHIPHICDSAHVHDPCGVFQPQTDAADAAPEDPGHLGSISVLASRHNVLAGGGSSNSRPWNIISGRIARKRSFCTLRR